jgi:hypothetical protein
MSQRLPLQHSLGYRGQSPNCLVPPHTGGVFRFHVLLLIVRALFGYLVEGVCEPNVSLDVALSGFKPDLPRNLEGVLDLELEFCDYLGERGNT